MKCRFLIVFMVIFITVSSLAQERPEKNKQIIVTPDGKMMSFVDGKILTEDLKKEIVKPEHSINDAPIGTPFSWDNNLNFTSTTFNTINAIVVSGSDVFIGGDFTNAMGIGADYFIRWNQKNNTWHTVGIGNELNGPVHAIAVSGNDVYVGGEFTDAGGNLNSDYIVRWDGSNWNSLGSGTGLNDYVYAIAVSGSDVFIGGEFIGAGGLFEADHIVKWDGNSWNAIGQLNDAVYSIVASGPEVFIGGAFTNWDYFAIYSLGALGSLGSSLNGAVYSIAVSGYDLYIGGAFTNAGGDPDADVIAHFDLISFSDWEALGTGIIKHDYYPNIEVRSLAVSGKDLYVGGLFWSPYNSYYSSVAYWNGTSWDSLGTGLLGACRSLALAGTDLYAGGDFFGLQRWFGAYAEGLAAGVQKPLTDGASLVEFNSNNDSTSVSLELNYYAGYKGVFNVLMYQDQPVNVEGSVLPIAKNRWIIQQKGITDYALSGNIRIKFIDLADSSGIIDPYAVRIFIRPTPGRGQFTELPTTYYDNSGEIVAQFSGIGEFVIGIPSTIDGVIDPNEYGSHVEGENMKTSDGKTWYMRTDNYFLYIGISNYTDTSDAINIYLDNTNIRPVNYPVSQYGSFIGTGKDGLTPNLPFGADYYAFIKPDFDEYQHTDEYYGWIEIDSNKFIKSYSTTNQVLEIAIPWSTTPYSEFNGGNIGLNFPVYGFNWLGFLSNSSTLSSRVPVNANPSGEANDLVWYYPSNLFGNTFDNESYTHIGPSVVLGDINCYDFNYISPGTTIDRASGSWNIEAYLFVYDGTLTFQNSDSVNVGTYFTAGGTTNFSFGSNDAPLFIKNGLYQVGPDSNVVGNINMNSGHTIHFITSPYNLIQTFLARTAFQNVVINNAGGVQLYSDMIIYESLNFLNGYIQTFTYDTFYVILDTAAVLNGIGGFIQGGLVKYIPISPAPNGSDSPDNIVINFAVGTANGPSPVSIDFSSVTSGGKLTVEAYQNIHPNTINSSATLSRYWRITKDEDLAFTSADITFSYRPEDFNGTTFSEATDEASMIVGKYDASWAYPSIFSRTPGGISDGGSITISGVTSFSDFTMFKSQLSANVKVFLEGPFSAGSMNTLLNTGGHIPLSQPYYVDPWGYNGTETVANIPTGVVDWILLELRLNTTTTVARRAAFLRSNGSLVDLDGTSNVSFPGVPAGNYYLVVYHRNHLPIMTANPVQVSEAPTLYDISTAQGQAYGTNAMKDLGGGVYGLYTADSDGSGTVNATDRSNTWNQRNLSGYYGTDVDLSGTVNAADRSSVWNNRNLSTQVPTTVDGPVIEIVKENNK